MICKNCGAKCSENDDCCRKCGYPLNTDDDFDMDFDSDFDDASSEWDDEWDSDSSYDDNETDSWFDDDEDDDSFDSFDLFDDDEDDYRPAPKQRPSAQKRPSENRRPAQKKSSSGGSAQNDFAAKLSGIADTVRAKYEEIKKDRVLCRRIMIIAAAAAIAICLFVVSCSCISCMCGGGCSACGSDLVGTWVTNGGYADGYDAQDVVYQFNRDGSITEKGTEVGYFSEEGDLSTVVINGMAFNGVYDSEENSLQLYISGTQSSSGKLIRVSGKLNLTAEQLDELY